jgi:hypothetical protein
MSKKSSSAWVRWAALGVAALAMSVAGMAGNELTGTVTSEEQSLPLKGVVVGATREVQTAGVGPGEAIPVEWTAETDENGVYRFDLDGSLPGMDRLLVFTYYHAIYNELYPAVDSRGMAPKGADVAEPGVVPVDLSAGPASGIDFQVARSEQREMVLMRDGVTHLDTRIWRPSRRPGMTWPVVLRRTPYKLGNPASQFIEADYVWVEQNTRGRFDSEGEDDVFDDDGWLEHEDGYDTVEWVAEQDFCTEGKVCTFGASAPGITQYMMAGATPPHLLCQIVEIATGNPYHDMYFPGGEFRKHLMETWLENQGSLHKLDEVFEHPNEDDYWNERNLLHRLDRVDVPILHIGGWYDIFTQGTMDVFRGLQEGGAPGARRNQKLVMGPWIHGWYLTQGQGELSYPEQSLFTDYTEVLVDWLDFWTRGADNGMLDSPPVRAYVMGPGLPEGRKPPGNFWRTSVSWPPPSTPTPYYLHPGGVLSPEPPTEASAETTYVADPDNPVPTRGGGNLYDDIGRGPMDQREVDARSDVVVWETPPLELPVEVSGRVSVVLHAASDKLDTDWVVKLEDVYPDGRAMLVTDMILQARHRVGFDREDLLTPGQVYEFQFDLWDTSIIFYRHHKIRVAIASSNYPRFESNPQTGEPFDQHTHTEIATQRILHDAAHPSHVLLPVVDTFGLEGCAVTEHVSNLSMTKAGPGEVELTWDPVTDPCHRRYRVLAGLEGPEWPWIVRRPIAETEATSLLTAAPGIFWQVISEATDGSNGPHGPAP